MPLTDWVQRWWGSDRNRQERRADGRVRLRVRRLDDRRVFSATAPVVTIPSTTVSYTENSAGADVADPTTISDADANAVITKAEIAITGGTYVMGEDELFVSGGSAAASWNASTGVLTLTTNLSTAQFELLIERVQYRNTSEDPTTTNRTISVTVFDDTNTSTPDTRTLQVTAVNDAPTVTQSTVSLGSTNEDTPSTGVSVATLLTQAGYADDDGDPAAGIAVTAVSSSGVWQYSVNNGTSWTAFGAVSSSAAVLLSTTTLVRHNPDADASGTVTFTFRAWDGSNNASASTTGSPQHGNAGSNGGTTAYSGTSVTASLTVVAVNDAPTINTGTQTLTTVTEEQTSSTRTVATLLNNAGYSDVDGPDSGIAIVQTTGPGKWQYSLNGTTGWTDITTVSSSAALLLDQGTSLRYVGDGEQGGTATLQFRAWDQSTGTASATNTLRFGDASTTGGSSAYSSNAATLSITVTSINDAPTVTQSTVSLGSTNEDTPSTGVSVATLLTQAGYADVDGDPAEGIAVTAVGASGTWQFSLDNGTTWTAFGTVGTNAALLLSPTTLVRQNPAANASGTVTFTFRAWDGSDSATASTAGTPRYGDANPSGGITAYSGTAVTASLTVVAVNDAPTINTGTQSLPSITEQQTSSTRSVSTILTSAGYADVDGPDSGIAVVQTTGPGTWQYSLNGINGWTDITTVSSSAALLLDNATSLRYVGDGDNGGTATLQFRAWDQSTGTASTTNTPSFGDASTTGGSSAFSANAGTLSINVTAINDAPVNTVPTNLSTDEDTDLVFTTITVSDVDAGTSTIETDLTVTNGTLHLTNTALIFSGANDTNHIVLRGTAANITSALNGLRFQPTADFNGTAVLTVVTNDLGNTGSGGAQSATVTRNIQVNAVNDPPVVLANASTHNFQEGDAPLQLAGTLTISDKDDTLLTGARVVVGNFDVNGDRLEYTIAVGSLITATMTGNTLEFSGLGTIAEYQSILRSVKFANDSSQPSTLTRTITFEAKDAAVYSTVTPAATVTVSVAAVNDPPTVQPIADVEVSRNTHIGPININIADPDNDASQLTVHVSSSNTTLLPILGTTLTQTSNNSVWTIEFDPATDQHGTAIITVEVTDGSLTTTTTFEIIVSDPPQVDTLVDSTVPEDSGPWFYFFSATDPEGQALTFTVDSSNSAIVAPGSMSVLSGGSPNLYALQFSLQPDANGLVTLSLVATDADGRSTSRSFVLTVTPVNDQPSIDPPSGALNTREDDPVGGSLTGHDNDPEVVQQLTFSLNSAPSFGTVVVNANGTFTYTPNADFSGDDSFTVVVTDDSLAGNTANLVSAPVTVNIHVTPVADAPIFPSAATQSGDEGTIFPIQFFPQLADVDGSEEISEVVIDGVPESVMLIDPNGVEYSHSLSAGHKTYVLQGAEFAVARFYALDDVTNVPLDVTFFSQEKSPAASAADQTASSAGIVNLNVANLPPQILNLSGADITSDAIARLAATLVDAPRDTFSVVITWGVSKIGFTQQTILSNLGPAFAILQQQFQFLIAPDPANPAAPVTITIDVTDNGGATSSQSVTVAVAGTGISTTIVRDLGLVEQPILINPFVLTTPQAAPSAPVYGASFQDDAHVSSDRTVVESRVVILKIVSSEGIETGESHQLPANVLQNLTKVLRKLPDGRYRLYLSENSFTPPRMLVDVMMFRGRPVAPGDMQANRPPQEAAALPMPTVAPPQPPPATVGVVNPADETSPVLADPNQAPAANEGDRGR